MINLKYQHILKVVLSASLFLNNASSYAGSCLSKSEQQLEDELFKHARKHPVRPDDYMKDKDPIFNPTSIKQPHVKGDKLKEPFYGSVLDLEAEELGTGNTSGFLPLAAQLHRQVEIKDQETSKSLDLVVKIGLNLLRKLAV